MQMPNGRRSSQNPVNNAQKLWRDIEFTNICPSRNTCYPYRSFGFLRNSRARQAVKRRVTAPSGHVIHYYYFNISPQIGLRLRKRLGISFNSSRRRGIVLPEMNDSNSAPVHFLQIWIVPDRRGVAPGYQQKALDPAALRGGFAKVVAPEGEPALFRIYQDARLFVAWPEAGQALRQPLQAGRRYYLHVARGRVLSGRLELNAGDAAMLENESNLELTAETAAELLLFDLPPP